MFITSINTAFESTTGWLLYLTCSFLMQYMAVGYSLFHYLLLIVSIQMFYRGCITDASPVYNISITVLYICYTPVDNITVYQLPYHPLFCSKTCVGMLDYQEISNRQSLISLAQQTVSDYRYILVRYGC